MDNKETKTIPMWKLKAKIKVEQAVRATKETGKKAGRWMCAHPMETIAIASALLGGTSKVLREVNKHNAAVAEKCRHYDRRSDEWHISTRPLKEAEKMRLERRYRDGELKSEVLKDMGLLKY